MARGRMLNRSISRDKAHGIPTEYRGFRFRSRLEAGWAAFFDLIAAPWSYEPVDLSGYVPDFVIGYDVPLLVEVKPAHNRQAMLACSEKIASSGWNGPAMIVGADMLDDAPVVVGLSAYIDEPGGPRFFDQEISVCARCSRMSLSLGTCPFCRGKPNIGSVFADDGLVRSMFATAKNRVQWRGGFGA